MKIFPLGVGGAFTKTNYHNNYIMQLDEKNLLIDAGTTLRNSLTDSGFSYQEIDFVFISHLHFDHVGGLEEMVMQRYWHFENGEHNPKKTTIIVHEKLYKPLYALLKNGLENNEHSVGDFCTFNCLEDGEDYSIGHYTLSLFDTSNLHVEGMLSFGFKLVREDLNIIFTADLKQLKRANILGLVDEKTAAIFQDTSFTQNGVHALLQEVLDYYPIDLHSKIYAMHYNDNLEPFKEQIKRAGIQLVKKGEVLEF